MKRRGRCGVLPAAAAALLVVACGAPRLPPKGPLRAVWIEADSAPPGRDSLERLRGAGVNELFLAAARLDASGRPVPVETPPLPLRFPATLVVEGAWTPGDEGAASTAARWAEAAERLVRDAEQRGAVPVGIHFDLEAAGAQIEPLADVLAALRRRLPGRLYLSATLPREAIGSEAARALAGGIDFVVGFLWGQSPAEAEEPASWDLDRAVAARAELAGAGEPFVVGGWTLGSLRLRAADGRRRDTGAPRALGRLVRTPGLEPRPGAVLEGIDHQVWELVAERPVRGEGWSLAPGESLRISAPARANLEEFLSRLADLPAQHQLGIVLRALPPPGDQLSLSPAALAATLPAGVPEPQLRISLQGFERTGRDRVRFRVRLVNEGDEASDLAVAGANYVELRIPGAVVAAVDPGGFARYEQLWHGTESRTLRALRQADTVRLFLPLVEGGESVTSGPLTLRWRGSASPRVRIAGQFLFPGGRVWNPPPEEWSFGSRE